LQEILQKHFGLFLGHRVHSVHAEWKKVIYIVIVTDIQMCINVDL